MDVRGNGDEWNGMLNMMEQLKKLGRSTRIC